MTELQKRKIVQFRKEGLGHMRIGQLVGLTTSTVRYFCKNNEDGTIDEYEYCKQCGEKLVQREGVKRRMFCCEECRHKWWNAHPERIDRRANYDFVCECCGKAFQAYGTQKRKYCSRECYIKARYGSDE